MKLFPPCIPNNLVSFWTNFTRRCKKSYTY
jgi:hypothetical protein